MEQPTLDIQQELSALADDRPEIVQIPYTNKRVKIGWIKRRTIRYVTELLNSKDKSQKTEEKIMCKAMAYIILNSFWKIKFYYFILWRWYFYIRQYQDYQCLPIIQTGKKKAPLIPYLLNMTSLNGLRDTLMVMTREEVSRSLQENSSDNKE